MNLHTGYKATRSADGVLCIYDVPIFVECQRDEHVFDGAWIEEALLNSQQAAREGYYPPLHVRHHEPGNKDVRAAGYFQIKRVGPVTFKGSERVAVFADLHITDPSVATDVLSKRLPYRSVEIFDVDKPNIDSLALLDHEAPYLELPMLMVAHVQDSAAAHPGATPGSLVRLSRTIASATFDNPWLRNNAQTHDPVVACFQRGKAAFFLMQDENSMNTKLNFADDSGEAVKDDSEAVKMEAADIDVAAIVAAIRSGSLSVAAMAEIEAAIAELRGGAAESSDEEMMPEPEESMMEDPDMPEEKYAAMRAARRLHKELARIAGENAALRARIDERDAAEKLRQDVTVAMQRLSNRPMGSSIEEKLVNFHRKHGGDAFAAYVDSMCETFAEVGDSMDMDAANFAAQSRGVSAEAMKFAKDGPDAVERASKFSREWRDLNSRGLARQSEARYIELNMRNN